VILTFILTPLEDTFYLADIRLFEFGLYISKQTKKNPFSLASLVCRYISLAPVASWTVDKDLGAR